MTRPTSKLPVALVLPVMLACLSSGQTPAEPMSGVEGVIIIGHNPPRMTRADIPGTPRLANAPFVVKSENGPVAEFSTDDQGGFRVLLAPGRYTVSQPDDKTTIRRCGPWGVDVAADKMTEVEWYCETGGARPDSRPLRSEAGHHAGPFEQLHGVPRSTTRPTHTKTAPTDAQSTAQ